MADSTGDASGQHAEGIQHIATNTAPPGTEDTHRGTEGGLGTGRESTVGTGMESGGLGTTHPTESTGMESSRLEPGAESGGVSSMTSSGSNTISPLKPSGESMTGTTGTTQSEGGMMGTVKSYLGYGSATGAETTDRAAPPQVGGDDRVVESGESATAGSGSGAGMSGAAASAASAVGMGSGNEAAGGGIGSTSSTSGAPDAEKMQENTNTEGSKSEESKTEATSGGDGDKPKTSGGSTGKLENKDAIPTAGGERLGEKHWGESKIVPDDPTKGKKSDAGVSSEEGQPTQQTTDNTSKNMGGATGPPGENKDSGSGSGNTGSEEKPSMMDKIKDKIGK